MSDVGSIVEIAPPNGKITFASYESVTNADTFVHPIVFLTSHGLHNIFGAHLIWRDVT